MSFFEWTGNPFVDGGMAAILEYRGKKQPREIDQADLTAMSMLLEEVYTTERWKAKLLYVFTINSPLLQNSYKTEEMRRQKYKEFLNELLKNTTSLTEFGDCIACGRRSVSKRKKRTDVPLTGSGTARGFFSFGVLGADYCDACGFAIQCGPLIYYACGGRKLALLHSNSPKVMKGWARKALRQVNEQRATNNYTGCFNEGFSNPQNALFHIAQVLVQDYKERWNEENATLRLYHFSNGNRANEVELRMYDLPAPVFNFLAEVQKHPRRTDWYKIVKHAYQTRREGEMIKDSSKGEAKSNFKNYRNQVYAKLLDGRSILPHFFNDQKRVAYCDHSLLSIYLREVLAMDAKRIETIKRVADEIALFIRESSKGKNRLDSLERSVKFRDFCNVLRRISKERIALRAQEPLFTLDEFAEQLFPDGALTFGETRYLILFRLYEQLHDWLLAQGLTQEEADDSIIEMGDDAAPTQDE